jgi:natural resistance-associated macrophage protein
MVEKKKKSGGPEEEWHISSENKSFNFSWRTFWAYTGPGWLMSMAYLDPGNLEADLQSGAYAKYELLYVVLLSTIVGGLYQILAARLGTCTGKHLAQLCRDEYSPKVSFCLWIMTELAIIGSDVQEVLGSAIAFEILFSLPLWAGCILTGLDTLTFLAIHQIDHKSDNTTNKVVVTKKSANYLEMFFMGLIGTMCVCFFVDFGLSEPNGKEIAQGIFVPEMKERNIMQAVGTIGAIIMPHNIFLHSALVQSRHINPYHHEKIKEANLYFGMEAAVALCVSFFINAAVICVFAGTFYSTECASLTSINSSHLFGTGIQTACIPSQVALQSGANIYDAKMEKYVFFMTIRLL